MKFEPIHPVTCPHCKDTFLFNNEDTNATPLNFDMHNMWLALTERIDKLEDQLEKSKDAQAIMFKMLNEQKKYVDKLNEALQTTMTKIIDLFKDLSK